MVTNCHENERCDPVIDNHILIALPTTWPHSAKELIAKLINAADCVYDVYADDWKTIGQLEIVTNEDEGEDADYIRETLEPFIIS